MWGTPGRIHLYCGDGKGKTTAAVGLCIRAAGAGARVVFTQFFKTGTSSELQILRQLPQVQVVEPAHPHHRFAKMDEAERQLAKQEYTALLEQARAAAWDGAGLWVLDEAVSACIHGMIQTQRLVELLRTRPDGLEVVLTGRNPDRTLVDLADYVTQMQKIKHPYDQGVGARRGIEY